MMKRLAFGLLVLLATSAQAEVIQFPEDELARESVLPVFDRPDSVQNRTVTTAKRFELGINAGWTMTDAFFSQMSFGGEATYHFTEVHGLNLMGGMRMSGTSSYAEQLNTIKGVTPLKLQNAPGPKYLALAHYQFTAYYGKLSLTKLAVGNISVYGLLGAGMMGIGDTSFTSISAGIGQKYYFSRNLALRFDLLILAHEGPNILSSQVNLSNKTDVQPASAFPRKQFIDTMLNAGIAFLL